MAEHYCRHCRACDCDCGRFDGDSCQYCGECAKNGWAPDSPDFNDAVAVAESLHAGNLERLKLREWRDEVASARGRVGGLRFDGVADEIRRLKSAYVSLSEAVWPGCRSVEDIEAASPSALVKDALLHREAYDRINDDARRVREDGFRDHTHAVAYDFVRYYVDGTEGCRNCGGFPHSSSCFVGRFVVALGLDSINRQTINGSDI